MQSDSSGVRPRTRTQQARWDDIVEATIQVLDSDGYAAASVDRIAQAAQTSKATVLYHFTTKEAIYDEVVRSLYERGEATMRQPMDAAVGGPQFLTAYLDANLRFIATNTAHVNAVHQILGSRFSEYDLPDGIAELAQKLAAGQADGSLDDFDPTVMAFAIRAVIDSFSFHVGQVGLDHAIAQITGLFIKATTN